MTKRFLKQVSKNNNINNHNNDNNSTEFVLEANYAP